MPALEGHSVGRRGFRPGFGFAVVLSLAARIAAAAPADQAPPGAEYSPVPYVRDPTSGVFARTVFRTREADLQVEIRRLSLGPGRSAKGIRLPGAVVLEVFSGEGAFATDKGKEALKVGSRIAVDEGSAFDLSNTGAHPLLLRAIVVRSDSR